MALLAYLQFTCLIVCSGHPRVRPTGAGSTSAHFEFSQSFPSGLALLPSGTLRQCSTHLKNWGVRESENWGIEKRDRISSRKAVKEIQFLNYRNVSQNRQLHLIRWNFRQIEFIVMALSHISFFHIFPSMFTLFYFIILYHRANIFFAYFLLFFLCIFPNKIKMSQIHACMYTYILVKLMVSNLYNPPQSLGLQRISGHININYRQCIYFLSYY